MTNMSGQGTDYLRSLGEAASRNPISAALIGMGALWLFSGRGMSRAAEAVRAGLDSATEATRGAFDGASSSARSGMDSANQSFQDSTAGAMHRAADVGRQQTETLSEYVKAIPDEAFETVDSLRASLTDLFRRQPLALGAIGMAVGASIAAAIPPTRTEAEYFGETADAAKDKAQELAAEQVHRAGEAAERALHAAGEEARNQGLTMEAAKSAASEMSAKAGRVLDAAKEGASAKAEV